MKDINWHTLYEGFLLCLVLQVLIIGLFKIFSSGLRNKFLGFFALLVVVSNHEIIFQPETEISKLIIYSIFKGPYEIFYGPILYLYLVTLWKFRKEKLRHLIFPIIYVVLFKIIITIFRDFYNENRVVMGMIHFLIMPFYLIRYFRLGIREFKIYLNDNLRPKALKKVKVFYYYFNIQYLIMSLVIFVPILGMTIFKTTDLKWVETVDRIFSDNIFVYIDPIILALFILYLLSESQKFKKFFLSNDIIKENFDVKNNNEIRIKVDLLFSQEKAYKNPNFNLTMAAALIEEKPKVLSKYILEKENMSFINYINTLRVREFKSMLKNKENFKYDLLSLSEEAGFKSKASFYRIFKNIEGITPGEYKNRLNKDSF